jgi:2-hydroxycyclohexanecarboxyl-CoA dehydrogenase
VERLASEGATVAIFDINKAAGEKLVSDLTSKSQKATFTEVDVSSKEKCVEAVKTVAEANSGQIHGLVNCVAYFGSKGITAEKEDWDKSFSVNVVGYANMVQACYEYMRKMPGEKSIVHTASISGHRCQPIRYNYSKR